MLPSVQVVLKRLFGPDQQVSGRNLSDILHKIDCLYQERYMYMHTHVHPLTSHHTLTPSHPHSNDMVLEIEALQQSSSKLNEERIFELKQRIEDLLMEQDALSTRNTNLKREASMMR